MLCFLGDRHSRLGFPLDDAWIHRVYSRSFAEGDGFAYNAGTQEAGCSSPLWVIATAPAHWAEPFGADKPVLLVKLVGVLLGLWAVWATAMVGRRLSGSVWMGCVAASLFALEPRLLFSALSGMEPILLAALWMWVCVALLGGQFVLALLLFGLLPVTRPEAAVILPLSALAMAGLIRRRGWGVSTIAACVLPLLPAALWTCFCHGVTGHWLPNTYYLKARPFHLGPEQLQVAWRSFSEHGFASLGVCFFGLAAWVTFFKRGSRMSAGICALVLVAAPAAYLLGVVGSRPISLDGYYWTRWVDPASLMLTAALCLGCGAIPRLVVQPQHALRPLRAGWRWAGGRGSLSGRSRPAAEEVEPFSGRQVLAVRAGGIALLVLLVLSLPAFSRSFADRRRHLAADSRCINVMNVRMAEWIRDHTPKTAVVTVSDAGALRYFARRRTIDLSGLNNSAIAFGKMSQRDVLAASDWLVIFPGLYEHSGMLEEAARTFEPRFEIRMPPKEYTICSGQFQTSMVAFERRSVR